MDLRTGRVPVRRCDGRGRGRCRGSGRHGEPTFPDRVALSLALISLGTSSGKATACLSSLAGRLEFLAVPRQRRIPLGDGKGLQDRLDTCQSAKDVFLQLQQATRLSPTAGVLPGRPQLHVERRVSAIGTSANTAAYRCLWDRAKT
jgi:hypothetical protein